MCNSSIILWKPCMISFIPLGVLVLSLLIQYLSYPSRLLRELTLSFRIFSMTGHDGEVFHGISILVEVCSNWFPCPVMFDVRSVASESLLQGILCHTNILYATLHSIGQTTPFVLQVTDMDIVQVSPVAVLLKVCFLDVITALTFFSFSFAFLVPCEGESRLD